MSRTLTVFYFIVVIMKICYYGKKSKAPNIFKKISV